MMPLIAALLGGCAGSLGPLPGEIITGGTPPESRTTTMETYSRIARAAKACWFAPGGPLSKGFIFHASVEPDSKGGAAEIRIHEREVDNRLGLRMFQIDIPKGGAPSELRVDNLKLAPDIGNRMRADALRWAGGGVGCEPGSAAWQPRAPETGPDTKGKTKQKPPAKPAKAPVKVVPDEPPQPTPALRPG